MVTILKKIFIVSVNVTICTGARTDIENEEGKTALQIAEEELSNEDDPEEKQHYEKVHEDTKPSHTLTLPMGAESNLVYL